MLNSMEKDTSKLHIAIIPDGNRRWAKKQGLRAWQGHKKALNNCRELLDWCEKSGRVSIMTLWGFSNENWKRSQEEVGHLMKLFEEFLTNERPTFHEKKTRFVHSGRKDRIPASLKKLIEDITEETKQYTTFTLHIALDYGGKNEIVRAVNKIQDTDITEETIRQHLDNPDLQDIDIIIRTSGEQRTSNFFLWQSVYAEWFFVSTFFPDFTGEDIGKVIEEFDQRQRRFGA